MIARRGKKAPAEGAPSADGTSTQPAAKTPPDNLSQSLAGALKFRLKAKEEKKDEKTAPAAATTTPPEASPAAQPPAKPGKKAAKQTITAPAIDAAQIAEAAATAATTAAMNAVQSGRRSDPEDDVASLLSEDERDEYAVAKFMEENYPQHKNAAAKYLDAVRKTSDYAQRWSAANPGKPFDPEDEDHDEFFAVNRKPWRDAEFRRAEAAMVAKEQQKSEVAKTNQELSSLKQENAKLALEKQVDHTTNTTWANVIQSVDEAALKHLSEGGTWDALAKKDPITARALSTVSRDIQPLVEAIIQIDDPNGRIDIDLNNPAHKRWADLLLTTERKYAGYQDEQGRTLVGRLAYGKMTPAQRANHFYLTHEHLLQELQDTMAETVKSRIKSERELIASTAESMGYVKSGGATQASQATTTTQPAAGARVDNTADTTTQKPISPSSGSSTKNDIKEPATPGSIAGVLQNVGKTLFSRG